MTCCTTVDKVRKFLAECIQWSVNFIPGLEITPPPSPPPPQPPPSTQFFTLSKWCTSTLCDAMLWHGDVTIRSLLVQRSILRAHWLPWETTCLERPHISGRRFYISIQLNHHQRPPVLRVWDHISMSEGVVFQERFYCTSNLNSVKEGHLLPYTCGWSITSSIYPSWFWNISWWQQHIVWLSWRDWGIQD